MRGDDQHPDGLFSDRRPEERVPADHPVRPIRAMVGVVLRGLSPEFARLYPQTGRPSIPPEKLRRALLLQLLDSIRSERPLIEQLDSNLRFRWVVGLSMDDPVWDPTVFTKNRERLRRGDIARAFFERVLAQAPARQGLSAEHFPVAGTLSEAWASLKSFKPTAARPAGPPDDPGNPTVNCHGDRRSTATQAWTPDPEARLLRKGPGRAAKLSYPGHVRMETRHGLAGDGGVSQATGTAARETGLARATHRPPDATLGGDKSYDTGDFGAGLRALGVTPPVAQNPTHRRSAIDGRTTRPAGYAVSPRPRKVVEEIFGWVKTVALFRKTRHRGVRRVGRMCVFGLAVYNLVRIRNLTWQPATA